MLPPINVIIRFGSGYGWPGNMLHHYLLQPNAFYNPSNNIRPTNLPYLAPKLVQALPSPLRLLAATHMAIGSHGTAVWIDSHTEDYFHHSNHGQRLAGSILTRVNVEHDEIHIDPSSLIASHAVPTTVFGVQESDGWLHLALDEEEGRIAVGSTGGKISIWRYV
jgi:hypothetical protein